MDKPSWKVLRPSQAPVQEFIGRLAKWTTATGGFNQPLVILTFDDLNIIASEGPYMAPTLDITLRYSERERSAWGRFGVSAAKALGIPVDHLDLDMLVGKRLRLRRREETYGRDGSGKDIRGFVWEVVDVQKDNPSPLQDGKAEALSKALGISVAEARALLLLDGANLSEFFQRAIADEVVKSDAQLVSSIVQRNLTQKWVEKGWVEMGPDGRYNLKI